MITWPCLEPRMSKMVPDTSSSNFNSLGLYNISALVKKNLKRNLPLCKRKAKRLKFWGNKSLLSLKEKNKHPVLRKQCYVLLILFPEEARALGLCTTTRLSQRTIAPFPHYYISLPSYLSETQNAEFLTRTVCPPSCHSLTTIHNILQELLQSLPSWRNSLNSLHKIQAQYCLACRFS